MKWLYCTGVRDYTDDKNGCICNKKLLQCCLSSGSWIIMKCPRCSTINEVNKIHGTSLDGYMEISDDKI